MYKTKRDSEKQTHDAKRQICSSPHSLDPKSISPYHLLMHVFYLSIVSILIFFLISDDICEGSCLNNATCTRYNGYYSCSCKHGYRGSRCESKCFHKKIRTA